METHDKQFRDLMTLYCPGHAPAGFTEKVMGQIRPKPVHAYKPVFGKWFLSIMAVLFGTFLIYAGFSTGPQRTANHPDLFSRVFLMKMEDVATGITGLFEKIPKEFVFVAFASILLLLIDRFYQQTHKTELK